MTTNFNNQISIDAGLLFPKGIIQVMIAPATAPADGPSAMDSRVQLVHIPTGISIICQEFPSQEENYIAAAIRLRIICDEKGV